MNANGHPDPNVIVKDALRGIHYALKRGAKLFAESVPRRAPEQFEATFIDFMNSAESLAKTVDRIVKHILGLKFDANSFGPPSFATALDAKTSDQHLSRDASKLFFALTLSAKSMEISDLLVSETLCARLIAEEASIDRPLGKQDPASLCTKLYRRIIATNILGDPPGVASQHNSERRIDVGKIAFATSLWVYLARGSYDDTEEELIRICCDLTAQKAEELRAAGNNNEALKALYNYALSIV